MTGLSISRRRAYPRASRDPHRVGLPWLFALPGVALLLAFHFVPEALGGWYAFTNWNGISLHPQWVGLRNFSELFNDDATRMAFFNTLKLAGSMVVLVNLIGLGLAVGLNRMVKSRTVLRAVFFLPVVMSPLAVSYIWQYIFGYNGPLNLVLRDVGLSSWAQPWLASPSFALWTILVVLVWQYSGLAMVIFLAGLQSVPEELYEAAAVDGASTWFAFRSLTLPMIAPAITINTTLMLIFGLRVFDQVLGLTGGGPVNASQTLASEVWTQTFQNGAFGYGSALALLLAALIAVLAITQTLIVRAREVR